MILWLLLVLLIASEAALGLRQGAVRVAVSFVGILFGALLAVPLGHLLARALPIFGIKDPVLTWSLAPVIVFLIISAIFKGIAAPLHKKVDVHFKYRASDLRLALWERISHRLGLCLGVLNGVAYAILLSYVIYVSSYATYQVASSGNDPAWMRGLNRLGADLHQTGLAKIGRSLDSIPDQTYAMVDLGALLYRNPLAQARISRYPAFLALGEKPEFQALGQNDFLATWQNQEPILSFINQPQILAIRNNPALLQTVWGTVAADLDDFRAYLDTGRSAHYDPVKILGRWNFNVNGAMMAKRRASPNIPSSEMQKIKRWMVAAFAKTGIVAKPDQTLTLNELPVLKSGGNNQTMQGEWKELQSNRFLLTFPGLEFPVTVDNDRMTAKVEGTDLVFDREE